MKRKISLEARIVSVLILLVPVLFYTVWYMSNHQSVLNH